MGDPITFKAAVEEMGPKLVGAGSGLFLLWKFLRWMGDKVDFTSGADKASAGLRDELRKDLDAERARRQQAEDELHLSRREVLAWEERFLDLQSKFERLQSEMDAIQRELSVLREIHADAFTISGRFLVPPKPPDSTPK